MPTPKRVRRSFFALVLAVGIVAAGGPAQAHDYDSTRSGHPLRIIAYVLHPIGVILDTLIMKPAHWLGSFEPIRTLVGHEED